MPYTFRLGQDASFGDLYDAAMHVKDVEHAELYIDALLVWSKSCGSKRSELKLRDVHMKNIGYWSGYHSEDTRRRIEKVFGPKAVHPVFGAVDDGVTAEEAFQMGMEMGKKCQKKQ